MKLLTKTAVVSGSLACAVAFIAPPAFATAQIADIAAVDVNQRFATDPYAVSSQCTPVAVASTDPRFLTFVIDATATAGGASVALSTGVICTAYDRSTGIAVGGASGALPGPHAAAVGTFTLPLGHLYKLCVTGGATYLNGISVPSRPC